MRRWYRRTASRWMRAPVLNVEVTVVANSELLLSDLQRGGDQLCLQLRAALSTLRTRTHSLSHPSRECVCHST